MKSTTSQQPQTTPATEPTKTNTEIALSLQRILALTDKPVIDDEVIMYVRYECECALKACA